MDNETVVPVVEVADAPVVESPVMQALHEGAAIADARKAVPQDDKPLSAFKVGNRNNADDQQRLQAMHDMAMQMHDLAVANGAECTCDDEAAESPAEDATETPQDEMAEENKSAVKSASDNPGDYLIVEDKDKPATWHLQVKVDGKPDHGLLGSAWAALHSGFRGNKYEGPNKDEAIAKLTALYKQEKMDLPSDKSAKSTVFDFSYVKSLHLPYSEQYLKDVIAVKSISPNRIRGYLALWGDESKVDVEGEYFTGYKASKLTDFWDGKLGFPRPLTYDHAQNKGMDASPIIGSIDGMGDDSIGRWYEAELDKSHKYRKAVDKLISQRASGTSSDSAPQYVVREQQKSGAVWLKQWPLFAGALTPTPAEPRMFDAGSLVWKSLSSEIEATRMGNVTSDGVKAEMAAYARQLELIKLYL